MFISFRTIFLTLFILITCHAPLFAQENMDYAIPCNDKQLWNSCQDNRPVEIPGTHYIGISPHLSFGTLALNAGTDHQVSLGLSHGHITLYEFSSTLTRLSLGLSPIIIDLNSNGFLYATTGVALLEQSTTNELHHRFKESSVFTLSLLTPLTGMNLHLSHDLKSNNTVGALDYFGVNWSWLAINEHYEWRMILGMAFNLTATKKSERSIAFNPSGSLNLDTSLLIPVSAIKIGAGAKLHGIAANDDTIGQIPLGKGEIFFLLAPIPHEDFSNLLLSAGAKIDYYWENRGNISYTLGLTYQF